MPPIANTCSPNLGIRLDKKHFRAGDTVSGWVYRASPVVCPDATVKISLHGATRTRMRSGVRWADTYQGHFIIIDGEKNKQQLFQGPVHVQRGSGSEEPRQEWPFAFTLPTHIDLSWFANNKHGREFFLPHGASIGVEPLPASFEKIEDGEYNEGIVGYYLRASLELRSKDAPDALTAILPIRIQPSPPEKAPSMEKSLHLRKDPVPFSMPNFASGQPETKPHLSTSQKMKSLLKPSSSSQFTHEIRTWAPTVLQLNDPKPISFLLQVTPIEEIAPELAEQPAPEVLLKDIEVHIDSLVGIKAETTYGSIDDGWKSHKDLTRNIPAYHSSGKAIPSTARLPPIDVGQMIDMRLPRSGEPDALLPSFSICNIKVEHVLNWKIEYEIEGALCKVRGSQALTILPPADAPPIVAYELSGSEPPSYQEGQGAPPVYEME